MNVTINPLALSLLLGDLSVGPDDVEGLLLGDRSTVTSTTIQDHADDHVQNSLAINITAHFSTQVCEI